ncbi:MAG: hypothetical protein R2867_36500 [Caldilineaceae bacterium]
MFRFRPLLVAILVNTLLLGSGLLLALAADESPVTPTPAACHLRRFQKRRRCSMVFPRLPVANCDGAGFYNTSA